MTVYDDEFMRRRRWRRLCERGSGPRPPGYDTWIVALLRRGDATPAVQAKAADLIEGLARHAEFLDERALRLEFGDGKVALPNED